MNKRVGIGSVILLVITTLLQVSAHGVPPRLRDVETKFRVAAGQKQFKLVCPVVSSAKDSVMVQWSKNGEQLDWDNRYKISKDGRELRMKVLRLDDSGKYECQATNGFGHKTIEFNVHVFDENDRINNVKEQLILSNRTSSPSWLIDMNTEWQSPLKINNGGKLELKCPAQGNPLPAIRWYRNEKLLNENLPSHLSTMVIDPVDQSHTGSYRCVVSNNLGSLSFTFNVSVADFFDPPTTDNSVAQEASMVPVIDQPYNITVYAGHTAQFQCKVKTHENTLIKWLKEVTNPDSVKKHDPNATIINANGMNLLVLDHVQSESIAPSDDENIYTNRLTISKVTQQHAGRYICVVTSAHGHIVYKAAELRVLSKYDFSFQFSTNTFFIVIFPLIIVFIALVILGIVWLKKNQEPSNGSTSKPPPPPRMPPPAAPQDNDWSSERTLHSSKPLLLNNSMFQTGNTLKYHHAATMDRAAFRNERRFDELSNVYDNSSVQQPCWPHQKNNNSIYNGGYRTLEVYNHRNYPTSDEYSDNDNFFYTQRR